MEGHGVELAEAERAAERVREALRVYRAPVGAQLKTLGRDA